MKANIPMSVEELTFSQYLEIKSAEKNYPEDTEMRIIETSQIFVQEDLPYGTIADIRPRGLILGDDITAVSIYCHVIYLIETYKNRLRDKDVLYGFKHHGETYQVTERNVKALSGMAFTVGEVVEVLQYQKVLNDIIKEQENAEKNKTGKKIIADEDCAMEFQLGLQEMAVLARKPGEALPVKRRELKAFLAERTKVFLDLPMNIVLDIRFFLLSGLKKLAATQTTKLFSMGLQGLPKTNTSVKPRKKPKKRPGQPLPH